MLHDRSLSGVDGTITMIYLAAGLLGQRQATDGRLVPTAINSVDILSSIIA
jgi:hypothetical protein